MNHSNNKSDLLELIFCHNLFLLSEDNVKLFINIMSSSKESLSIINVLNKSEKEHIQRIDLGNQGLLDEYSFFKELSVYLWKQKYKRKNFKSTIILNTDCLLPHQVLIIHRQMYENNYQGILSTKYQTLDLGYIRYDTEIKRLVSSINDLTDLNYDADFSWFCKVTNIIGSKLTEKVYYPKIFKFAEYLSKNYRNDPRIYCSMINELMLLFYDISYKSQNIWELYKHFINDYFRDISAYTAYIIGMRIFGKEAKKEIEKLNIIGGIEFLELLS